MTNSKKHNSGPVKLEVPSEEEKVAFLQQAVSYPERPSSVEVEETHMSWVFLTDRYVYKFKKPVERDRVNLRTLEARRKNCEEEIRLNRRLAPDVYLGIATLRADAEGNLYLEEEHGEVVEWLVKMRRLPRKCLLDHQIGNQGVDMDRVTAAAERLAGFYRQAKPEKLSADAYVSRITADLRNYHKELLTFEEWLPMAETISVREKQLHFLSDHASLPAARAREGYIVEGHGDLRPEHVCLTDPPVIIDCLEFDRELRIIDPVEDLALLFVECEVKSAKTVGERFLNVYMEQTGDQPPAALVNFYKSQRALIRALLSIRHLADDSYQENADKWVRKTREYLELAEEYLTS